MGIVIRPAEVFDDVAVLVGPKKPTSNGCFRVRPGHRKQGVMHTLIGGAVEYAREHGAPAVEGYPVDNHGEKISLTMAYVGTRSLFESAGFVKVADTLRKSPL